MRKLIAISFACLLTSVGCSQGFKVNSAVLSSEGVKANRAPPVAQSTPAPTATPASSDPGLNICSQLDFAGITWPAGFVATQRRAMALSLNITGSFEGGGWSNLANNFDGQGFSLGLNQQNLGQGTLQPILNTVLEQNRPLAEMLFTATNLRSLSSMLTAWSRSAAVMRVTASAINQPLFSEESAISPLDEGFPKIVSALGARENASVAWAVESVYQSDRMTFKPDWKKSLQSFAAAAPFRSVQVKAANGMFTRASAYFTSFKFHELRSIILMYDFVVQNGGFTSAQAALMRQWDSENSGASETARLLKLLEIRVLSVRAQYRGDVNARKKAIINGVGTVHGSARNLPSQYCYRSKEQVIIQP